MRRKYLIPALLALSSAGVLAQTTTSARFLDVDTDSDGAISKSELAAAGFSTSLATADTDGDGSISHPEYVAGIKAHSSTRGSIEDTTNSESSVSAESYAKDN